MSSLRAKQYAPIYLLMGDEGYYIDEIANYIIDHVLTDSEKEFNLTIAYGSDVDIAAIINAAKRYPMMAEYQVVVVKEAQNVKNMDELAFYLQKPLKSTILVICHKHGKIDGRKKWVNEAAKMGVVFESKKLKEQQMPAFINSYMLQKGYEMDTKATQMMADFVGTDLGRMTGELDKLIITQPKGQKRVTPEQIERNIGISKDYNVFELQSAIGRRDVVQCNRIVNHFAANPKDNPIQMVLPSLYNYFIKIMVYHQLEDKDQAASALKVNPYFVRDYATAAGNYPLGKLASCIGYLNEADLRSKGIRNAGTVTDGELLKELVFKIIH